MVANHFEAVYSKPVISALAVLKQWSVKQQSFTCGLVKKCSCTGVSVREEKRVGGHPVRPAQVVWRGLIVVGVEAVGVEVPTSCPSPRAAL
ncbi:hypothetical protein CesoFtcFv8_023569 [Champsocephalus esox]|uniref:Uncharacterized protein n=1 Tax=Champsocephalus esox TaxID=159716 RepID=A0AAN8B8N6_9TELE|nr:hypothetical protein CesoFtcFv8_023569 [Champsocephalus esox]